jgi:hypothetical protein
MHPEALELYEKAASLGLFIAHLNKANVLELQGYMKLAKESFKSSLAFADNQVQFYSSECIYFVRVYLHSIFISGPQLSIIEYYHPQLMRLKQSALPWHMN